MYFWKGASKHLYSLAARRPVRVAFFTPPFWRNLCLILRVWANTRPACREYARRSKDGFEHPEFSILKAPIKKILGVHHVRNAFSCFRSPSRCGISRRPASERGSGPAPFRHAVRRRTPRACEGRANPRGNPPLSISSFGCALRKELLEAENAEEMRELLFRAFSSLETFADLLELMNPEAKVEGVVMHTLARDCGVSAEWCSRSKTLTALWSLWKHSPTTAIQITKRITQKALSDKPPRAFFQHTGKTGESHPYRRRGNGPFPISRRNDFF